MPSSPFQRCLATDSDLRRRQKTLTLSAWLPSSRPKSTPWRRTWWIGWINYAECRSATFFFWINELSGAQQTKSSKDQETGLLKDALAAKDDLLSRAQDTLVRAVSTAANDKEDIERLTAQLDARTKELDAEREAKEKALSKQIEAEIKENSACKHQSSLAKKLEEAEKRLEAARDKAEEQEKKKIETEQAKIKAEQRAMEAENAVSSSQVTIPRSSSQARRNGSGLVRPHPRVIADLRSQIINRDQTVQRCNVQLADAKVSWDRMRGELTRPSSTTQNSWTILLASEQTTLH